MKKIILIGMSIFLILLIGCTEKQDNLLESKFKVVNTNEEIIIDKATTVPVFIFRETDEIDYDRDISKYESIINENCGNDTKCKIEIKECLRSKKCNLFTEVNTNARDLFDKANTVSRIIFSETNYTDTASFHIDNDTIIIRCENKIVGNINQKLFCESLCETK